LGALHAAEGLPEAWLQRLEDRGAIEDEARQLAELSGRIARSISP
jgi:hypothetical protein